MSINTALPGAHLEQAGQFIVIQAGPVEVIVKREDDGVSACFQNADGVSIEETWITFSDAGIEDTQP